VREPRLPELLLLPARASAVDAVPITAVITSNAAQNFILFCIRIGFSLSCLSNECILDYTSHDFHANGMENRGGYNSGCFSFVDSESQLR